jgi:HAD superfamily hydrolase (TIGR01509 family)
MPHPSLRTLFLDAGGVLIEPNWERVAGFLRRHGVGADGAALRAAEPQAKRTIDDAARVRASDDAGRGVDLFHLVLERCGIARSAGTDAALRDVRDYHARHNLWELVIEGAPAALDAFRSLGLRLVVVSNANGRLDSLLDRLDLRRRVDVVVDSHLEGVEKPDPALFRIALERAGAQAATTLHVGDLYEIDVVGARGAGLRQALIDPDGLYAGADCDRFPDLAALGAAIVERRI